MSTVKLRSPFTTRNFFIGLISTAKKLLFWTENKVFIRKFSTSKKWAYSELLKRSKYQTWTMTIKKWMHLKIIFIVNLYSCWVLYFCVRKNLKDLKDENSLLSYLTKLSLQTDATDNNNMFEIQMFNNSFKISTFIFRYLNVCFISRIR